MSEAQIRIQQYIGECLMSTDADNTHNRTAPENNNDPSPETTTETTNNSNLSQLAHKRVGRTSETKEVIDRVAALNDKFIHSDPPETVGEGLDDDVEVKRCLATAVEYFHEQLPDNVRDQITAKWGISDEMIDARKIGFVYGTNDVVTHLQDQGYRDLTIARASIATDPVIKHVFECRGVSPKNGHLVNGRIEEIDDSCSHTVDEKIDTLVQAQIQGIIQPNEIDLDALAAYISKTHDRQLWNWWDKRIVFPYKNEDNEFCYLAVRATEPTDDRVYNNGVADRSDNACTPLIDTQLGRELLASEQSLKQDSQINFNDDIDSTGEQFTEDVLNEYTVLPHVESVYNTPYERDNETDVTEAVDTLIRHQSNTINLPDKELHKAGIVHHENGIGDLQNNNKRKVHVFDGDVEENCDSDYFITPPALGIHPDTEVEVVNHTDATITFDVATTPNDVWWENNKFTDSYVNTCPEEGLYRYKLQIQGADETYRGIFVVYDEIYVDRRSKKVEQWVGDEPGFEIDQAKYMKQTVDRDWINNNVISEPIFGSTTVIENEELIVTEGITDAIIAHQYDLPCVSPVTTNFKQHHYDEICNYAEQASAVFVVNDNEINNAGTHGALRTAKVIENNGHNAYVGELPRPENKDKIDLAEYFLTHSRDDFISEMKNAIPPEEHELFSPERHDPEHTDDSGDYNDDSAEDASFDGDTSSRNRSYLYDLSIREVIDFASLRSSGSTGSELYRGVNPIQHHGNSKGYFRIKDIGGAIEARDFKIEYGSGSGYRYNALTYLATAASCNCSLNEKRTCDCTRSVHRPMGSLSNSEVWWAWKHAKEASHISMPDDDPVPLKALWFLAEYHDLLPSKFIPDTFDDENQLPKSKYNEVLDIIETEYGLNPGRRKQ